MMNDEERKQIIDWMVKNRCAQNEYNAAAMIPLLALEDLERFWARCRRVIIYRQWRNFGVSSPAAALKAIANYKVRDYQSAMEGFNG